MPKIWERLVSQLKAKGMAENSAYAVATSTLQKAGDLKKGTRELTAKGARRQAMGAAGRAKDRAAKYSHGNHEAHQYRYSKRYNRATLKD